MHNATQSIYASDDNRGKHMDNENILFETFHKAKQELQGKRLYYLQYYFYRVANKRGTRRHVQLRNCSSQK